MNNDIVIINLDKPRQIKLGNKALKKLEILTGKTIQTILKELEQLSMDTIFKVIYVGLEHEDKEITLEKVEDLLDDVEFATLYKAVGSAFISALGKQKTEEIKNPNE